MIDYRLLLHLLTGIIFLSYGVRAFVIFLRRRTKYNLATVIVLTILLIGTTLNYFYPGSLSFVGEFRVPSLVVFSILLVLFLFYPEINRFLSRRKTKNK